MRFMRHVAIAAAAVPAMPAAAQTYTVTAEKARCLSDHADAYLAEPKPVYIIPIEACPDPAASLSAATTASSASPDANIAGGTGDGIVVLTPMQLQCLRDRLADFAIPVGDGRLVTLDLAAC